MAATWRDERPEAITAASARAERPSRSMATMFSALSSSSEARMRFSRSLGGAAFGRGSALFGTDGLRTGGLRALATDFFFVGDFATGATFFTGGFAVFFATVFSAAVFLAGFPAGAFLGFRAATPWRKDGLSRDQARLQG